MTQHTSRQEPTFGESKSMASEAQNNVTKPIIPSLRMNHTPGHTFTPVLKPTGSTAPQAENPAKAEQVAFAFTPVIEPSEMTGEEAAENLAENSTPNLATESEIRTTTSAEASEPSNISDIKIEPVLTAKEPPKSVAQDTLKVALNAADRVISTASTTQTSIKSDSENKTMKEISSKKRRLGLVAILVALLVGIFFWLKPNQPETVEELQSQSSGSLPIEFRPVDEAEAQRLEAEAQAEAKAQAEAMQQAQQNQAAAEQAGTPVQQEPTNVATQPAAVQSMPAQPEPVQPMPEQSISEAAPTTEILPPSVKPQTQESVVYQPENNVVRKVEKAQPQKVKKAEPAKVKAITAAEYNAKKAQNAQLDQLIKNVEAGKSVPSTKAAKSPVAAVSAKTMTVPKGISLMQVFRDNNLNISDVNAMNKVNSVISNLKANEKVSVRLDQNNRVVEMSIGSGGKFTRQADGSYRFK